ncbi:MAG TPA: NADH-quinone oxidoreductase subunit NuoE [Microthrixaceae bacterium]|nr:NADH-quinone oxidoreductase subunit NuoE [Microthrixaceae bacterium]MCB9401121.1 NADH-quinone oxidoreductase subunit NuoE [Microthrixaceae bacterium]RTL08686.1 MAG: NADH-quinone oxidoreductase subunit E [Acidimicrobiia bacterium]HPG15550.1 NADH-quinone oxidoreductase subunit NuoE [Microthrixaceae bacterium]HRW40631.1 NADH-quinone oxidoreductase subunit NuoE [Microthrixaceae bacterium]
MARLTPDNEALARAIIARYPRPKSALIPLCHLAQEQDGWLTDEAMVHIGELIGCTSAEVLGTASFYEMFKLHPVGRYCVNVCTNISCQLLGAEELLEHAEETLGIRAGGTTEDGAITLEDVECIAACTEAPAIQVNYRYFHNVTADDLDQIIAEARAGTLSDRVPDHGTLGKVRQDVSADELANVTPPEQQTIRPWIARHQAAAEESA